MKPAFLIIASTCLFLQSEGRVFRGNFLQGQDPHDIAGHPTNTQGTTVATEAHARATGDGGTKKILKKEIAAGLRKDFQFIHDSLTQFADEDGIVREGIVYCGSGGDQTMPSNFHAETGLLSLGDGYAKGTGDCSCEDGSLIALLANRIGALGYRITHADLCKATDLPDTSARTCNLRKNVLGERKSWACNKLVDGNDQYQADQECLGYKEAACDNEVLCVYDTLEDICISKYTEVQGHCASGKEKPGERIAADGAEVNAVRRNFAFSIKSPGIVATTDKAYVTGAVGGCKSLFDYVAALNGLAQINAFRDTGIEETAQNWNNVIKEARTYIESYANILSDFYEKSTEMFPVIEYEELEECPSGDVEKSGDDLGTKDSPLCDQATYNTRDTLNAMTSESQDILRSKCFCRKGKQLGGSAIPASTDTYEADEFYLSFEQPNNCTVYNSINDNLQSVHQFCKMQMLEGAKWKSVLGGLEPQDTDIHVYGSTSKGDIRDKVAATLPLVADNYVPSCGRIISSDDAETKISNKGGNCVPFAKMNDLLYRLEFETSQYNSGKTRGNGQQQVVTFVDTFCSDGERLANTQFTFRQLAYQWDHARAYAAGATPTTPLDSENIADWSYVQQLSNATNLDNQQFYHGDAQMCNIDWTHEITGEMVRTDFSGGLYTNPYELFDREIGEAIFATEVAKLEKEKVAGENEKLWRSFKSSLTGGTSDLVDDIAGKAAGHFEKILQR